VAAEHPRATPLSTARLRLEPLSRGHAAEMVEVLADPALYRFTGGEPPTAAVLADRYERQARGRSQDGREGWLNWVLRSGPRPVGTMQATVRHRGAGLDAELAWVIAPEHQGRGFATEAAGAVVAWLREVGVGSFSALIAPGHTASERVAARLGLAATAQRHDGEVRWASTRARPATPARRPRG
jgi:RimJ/RimL family protein N-acetyltransferase